MQYISPIKHRILQYIDTLDISKRDFYAKTGISRGTLESLTGITEETVAKFIAFYTEINPTWLLTGNGAMLNNKKDQIIDNQIHIIEELNVDYVDTPGCEKCKIKNELITILRQQVDTQSKLINYFEECKTTCGFGQKGMIAF